MSVSKMKQEKQNSNHNVETFLVKNILSINLSPVQNKILANQNSKLVGFVKT